MSKYVDADGCGCILLGLGLGIAFIILSVGGCYYLVGKGAAANAPVEQTNGIHTNKTH